MRVCFGTPMYVCLAATAGGWHRRCGVTPDMPLPDRDRPLRVLAVEDDADLREFYREILSDEGHEVRLASHGLEGLHHLDWAPDLILLDLMLPVMDGYEFLRRLRSSPRAAHVPVLVLSAAIPPRGETVRGAQAVLRKPFDFERLLRTIELYGNRPRETAN